MEISRNKQWSKKEKTIARLKVLEYFLLLLVIVGLFFLLMLST